MVAEVAEKRRISHHCCSGIYHFSKARLFLDSLHQEENSPSMNELFVAPLYQRLIDAGHRIGYSQIKKEDIFFSGTPLEYLDACRQSGDILRRYREAVDLGDETDAPPS